MFKGKNIVYKNILNIENLSIKSKKVTCILGESGSGKTTLLKILNKMITIDNGELFYNDKSLKEIDSITLRREVIMLPQNPIIYEGTIRDNLNIGLSFSEKPNESDETLEKVLQMIKLNKSLDESASTLSGGEKQRLSLGRVIVLKPEVLLLDEPSSSLDEETEKFIISSLVQYIKENDKTLIMVTHSKKIAKDFSDHIIVLENGTIKEVL